jgi:hypothetical protein
MLRGLLVWAQIQGANQMSLWLAKPVYELMPYLYIIAGAALLTLAWLMVSPLWPTVFLIAGCISLLAGLTLWLRRRDYRTTQSQYNQRSLDD